MVAVASLLPENPEDEASVLALLKEHPELRTFIQQTSGKAQELFPGVRISLDAVQREEWDPPVRLVLPIPGPWESCERGWRLLSHGWASVPSRRGKRWRCSPEGWAPCADVISSTPALCWSLWLTRRRSGPVRAGLPTPHTWKPGRSVKSSLARSG